MADALRDTLIQAAFAGIEFPVSDSTVDGGSDFVAHTAYLRKGADVEPCGVKPLQGKLTIPLFNSLGLGELFPARYLQLLRQFERTPIGQLSHPTQGIMTALIASWREITSPDKRNGVVIEVEWIEHNATATRALLGLRGNTTDTPTRLQRNASRTDQLVNEALNVSR